MKFDLVRLILVGGLFVATATGTWRFARRVGLGFTIPYPAAVLVNQRELPLDLVKEVGPQATAIRRLARKKYDDNRLNHSRVAARLCKEIQEMIKKFAQEDGLTVGTAGQIFAREVQDALCDSGRRVQPTVRFKTGPLGKRLVITNL